MRAFTYRTANVVDMLVVQDGEEPSPQIGAVLPEMLFGDSPGQAVLDEIVGACHVPGQRARIPAQPRDLRFEHPSEVKFLLENVSLILAVEADLKPNAALAIENRVERGRLNFAVI
jgi:hypothetical protein